MTDLKKLIKYFMFDERSRSEITLSDPTKIRLNTEAEGSEACTGWVQLNGGLEDVNPFPLDTDLTVTTRITTPNGIKQWTFFQAVREEPDGTTIRYRFTNGDREIYWDGANWVTAGSTDWNTEAEIQANISTFPFDNNSIGVIANLITTDEDITPKLLSIKLLGLFEFEVYEDLFKSILMKFHEEIRPVTDAARGVVTTTNTFDFTGDYKLSNSGYNIVDVLRVYNKTDDPFEKTNLVDTYTPGPLNQDGLTNAPGSVTTTSPVDAGKIVKFKIQYVPEVADYTDEDYFEVAKVPLIAIETVEELHRSLVLQGDQSSSQTSKGDIIKDLTNMTAVQVLPPAQVDLRIGYAVFTDSSRDQKRLMEAIDRFFQKNKLIYSFAFDEPYSINSFKRIEFETKGTTANLRKATGEFDVRQISLFETPALDVPLVGEVNVDITT